MKKILILLAFLPFAAFGQHKYVRVTTSANGDTVKFGHGQTELKLASDHRIDLIEDDLNDYATLDSANGSGAANTYVTGKDFNTTMATFSSFTDSLSVLSSDPATGNIYINSVDKKIHYLAGGYWHRLAILDSIYTTNSLLDGLISYWTFDEPSGALVDSKNGYNLAGYSVPTFGAAGKINTAMNFPDGTQSCVYRNTPASFNPPADVFSISMWVYLTTKPSISGHAQYFLRFMESGDHTMTIYSEAATDYLIFNFEQTNDAHIDAEIPTALLVSTWYHIVCVARGSGQKPIVYINNASTEGASNQTANIKAANSWFLIGNEFDDGDYEACGIIDEVGFWHRALTASDVASLYGALPYTSW